MNFLHTRVRKKFTRTTGARSGGQETAEVRRLTGVLQAVVGDAHETHPESDGRVPPAIHDAIERAVVDGREHGSGAFVDGGQV